MPRGGYVGHPKEKGEEEVRWRCIMVSLDNGGDGEIKDGIVKLEEKGGGGVGECGGGVEVVEVVVDFELEVEMLVVGFGDGGRRWWGS